MCVALHIIINYYLNAVILEIRQPQYQTVYRFTVELLFCVELGVFTYFVMLWDFHFLSILLLEGKRTFASILFPHAWMAIHTVTVTQQVVV